MVVTDATLKNVCMCHGVRISWVYLSMFLGSRWFTPNGNSPVWNKKLNLPNTFLRDIKDKKI